LADDHDREMPLILGLMPILPRHAVNAERFEETSLAPPLGSGPYVVADVDAGRSVTLRRNPAYWGRDLAVNRGLWNFDTMRLDFYRDGATLFEAFKKGLCDVREETGRASARGGGRRVGPAGSGVTTARPCATAAW